MRGLRFVVMPAKAGIQGECGPWVPAFAGTAD